MVDIMSRTVLADDFFVSFKSSKLRVLLFITFTVVLDKCNLPNIN
jgi:hypothetical protein